MSLAGKEKIWFLVNRLNEEREVTSAGQPVSLHPMNDLNGLYPTNDLIQLVEKLEKDKVVKLVNLPTDQTFNKYQFKLLSEFDNYAQELRKDPKYLAWIGEVADPEPATKKEPLSVSHARKNGVMTGKEKIQTVIENINDQYQGLISGSTIILHSGILEERGIQLHEQKQVLDILANDKKVIKYVAKSEYESRADIHPRDQVDIHEVAMDEIEANEMFDRMLEQKFYTVEVLSAFTALADELLASVQLEHNKDIFLLRLLYNRVISILDAVVSSGIVIEDDKLDFEYIRITSLIENILKKPLMKDWAEAAPELYETLMGHAEDIGEGWQYSRTDVLKYYAKLQKEFMLNNNTEFELDDSLTSMFEKVDELIAEHKKAAREAATSWGKRVDAIAKDYRAGKIDLNGKVIIDKQEKPRVEKPDDTVWHEEEAEPVDQSKVETGKEEAEKVRFDAKASNLILGNKTCHIPDETLEHYVCKLTFKNRRVAAKETDILEYTVKSQDSKRPVYDAMLRVNSKASKHLGVQKLLYFKASKIRITTKYQ